MNGVYRYVLTDVKMDHWTDSWAIDEGALPLGAGAGWRVEKRTLRGGLQEGVDLISIDNGALSFQVLPTRGMGIWKGRFGGLRLGWDSPVRDGGVQKGVWSAYPLA